MAQIQILNQLRVLLIERQSRHTSIMSDRVCELSEAIGRIEAWGF